MKKQRDMSRLTAPDGMTAPQALAAVLKLPDDREQREKRAEKQASGQSKPVSQN